MFYRLNVIENREDREAHTGYFLPKVKIKDCNVRIDEKSFFDQPVKNNLKTNDNIQKITTGQGHDHITGCLLDYPCFKEH